MRLSISNIGWSAEHDETMYKTLADMGFSGIEIAPTRIFPVNPYSFLKEAVEFKSRLHSEYGLSVCSMQSIWYGKSQRISATAQERAELLEYTQNALCFAQAIGCTNLVFGCPRNRAVLSDDEKTINEAFLIDVAENARSKGVIIALEPNPKIYNTNYINTTQEAIELLCRLSHPNLKLNLDLGTVIENNETLDILAGNISLISHVHISEPHLAPIQTRALHNEVIDFLCQNNYQGYVSIEMGNKHGLAAVGSAMRYLSELVLKCNIQN